MKKAILGVLILTLSFLIILIPVLIMDKIEDKQNEKVSEYLNSVPEKGTYISNGELHTFEESADTVNDSGASNTTPCIISNESKAKKDMNEEVAEKVLPIIYDYNIRLGINETIEFTYTGEKDNMYTFDSVYGAVSIGYKEDMWQVIN